MTKFQYQTFTSQNINQFVFLSSCSDIWWCSDKLKIYLESASRANSVMTHRGKESGSGRYKHLNENEKRACLAKEYASSMILKRFLLVKYKSRRLAKHVDKKLFSYLNLLDWITKPFTGKVFLRAVFRKIDLLYLGSLFNIEGKSPMNTFPM